MTRTPIQISAVDPSDSSLRDSWNAFAEQREDAHLAHAWEWQDIFSRTFGLKPSYQLAKSGAVIEGILPLFEMKSFLFGSSLISVPYLNGGGMLASSDSVEAELLENAKQLVSSGSADYLELRHRAEKPQLELPVRSHKVTFLLDLPDDAEVLFSSFPAKLRSQIRRPNKAGMYAESYVGPEITPRILHDFYEVFSRNMRDLGTPVYPKRLFEETAAAFNKRCSVVIVRLESKPVAAGMAIEFANAIEIPWASHLKRYNRESPNMLLYWEMIRTACARGVPVFDFGRTTIGSGAHKFKLQWGSRELPLHWHYILGQGEIPDVNPRAERFSLAVQLWRHLPLPVANALGPQITKSIP